MTGGMAFVYDAENSFETRVNPDSIVWQRIQSGHWEAVCRDLIAEHFTETQSHFTERLLADWRLEVGKFWQICPKEMIERLEHPLSDEAIEKRA